MSDVSKVLQDCRYFMIESGDDEAVHILDAWLEEWLWRKTACPNCGNFNENDEYAMDGFTKGQ
jgi:hypothetical protein